MRLPRPIAGAAIAATPFAFCVLTPRTRLRDIGTCCLQMYVYLNIYRMPNDNPEALRRRVHIHYPVSVDRVLGAGELPTIRLQRALSKPNHIRPIEKILIWTHWSWFLVPHISVAYTLLRRSDRFTRTAAMVYGVFDIGMFIYAIVPTAPPWFAAQYGVMGGKIGELRRMMCEYGEQLWRDSWGPLYRFFGGNPLAAMPSLHFGTSVMAASMLYEIGPIEGIIGWTYALTLGVALVYLGEHYVIDLIAGFALSESVRRLGPKAAPLLRYVGNGVRLLEIQARG